MNKISKVPCSNSISWWQSDGSYLFFSDFSTICILHSSHCLETFSYLWDFWGHCLLWNRSQDEFFKSPALARNICNTTISSICLIMFNIWFILKLRNKWCQHGKDIPFNGISPSIKPRPCLYDRVGTKRNLGVWLKSVTCHWDLFLKLTLNWIKSCYSSLLIYL